MVAGGGGDERDNFATTAFFQTVKTDENGIATIEVTFPDNVTSWNIFAQSITKEFKAGYDNKIMSVTLPYFVTPIYKEQYLVGEEPSINIRSNGISVKNGDNVEYVVTLSLPNGESITENITSKIGKYAPYNLPTLINGEYELKVYGKCKDYSDTVVHKFEVIDTLLKTKQINNYELIKNNNIKIDGTIGKIYLLNENTNKIAKELFYLANLPYVRNDQKVQSILANELLMNFTDNQYGYQKQNEVFNDKGIKLMENAQPSLELSAKIISTGYKYYNANSMTSYFEDIALDESMDMRNRLFAYWGLSAMKKPVLTNIRNFEQSIDLSKKLDRIILGLAYADIGDYNNANRIFDQYVGIVLKNEEEIYEYLTILAIKLNRVEKDDMYNAYLQLDRETEYSNFIKLYYVQNEILHNTKKASITLQVNGEKQQIDLNNIGFTILTLTQKDDVKILKTSKNVKAFIEEYKNADKTINNNNILSREYIVNDKTVKTLKFGDIVINRIYIDYDKIKDERFLIVEDIIPNCMVYLTEELRGYDKNKVKTPNKINGQKITFSIYKSNDTQPYIEYMTRVIGTGKYISDGTILKSYKDNIIDYNSFDDIYIAN